MNAESATQLSLFQVLDEDTIDSMLGRSSGDFEDDIHTMHGMYRLPVNDRPTLGALTKPNGAPETASARINGFLKTLSDEISEGSEIRDFAAMLETGTTPLIEEAVAQLADPSTPEGHRKFLKFKALVALGTEEATEEAEKVILTMLADWLADITVFVRSEALKFGIPLDMVLTTVMASNFTKLPSDGVPKHDENGKFLKDMTNYVPPENAIHTIIHDPEIYEVLDADTDGGDPEEDDDEDEDY